MYCHPDRHSDLGTFKHSDTPCWEIHYSVSEEEARESDCLSARMKESRRNLRSTARGVKSPWYGHLAPRADASEAYCALYQAFISVDWKKTSLGPLDLWDRSLWSAVSLAFSSDTQPIALFLGPEHYVVYNVPAIAIYKDKHPAMMGQTYHSAWRDLDIYELSLKQIHQVESTGISMKCPTSRMLMNRREDNTEEVYLSWEWLPFLDDEGIFSSTMLMFKEETAMVLLEKRRNCITALQDALASAKSLEELYELSASVLSTFDSTTLAFCDLYRTDDDGRPIQRVIQARNTTILALDVDRLIEKHIDLSSCSSEASKWTTIDLGNGSLHVLSTSLSTPETTTSHSHSVIVGVNPLQSFDSACTDFVQSVVYTIQITIGRLASSNLLSQSEARFEEMILRAPIGFLMEDDTTRAPLFANAVWRNMLNFHVPIDEIDADSDFGALVHESVRDSFMRDYRNIGRTRHFSNFDLRLAAPYVAPNHAPHPEDNIHVRVSTAWLPPSYRARAAILWFIIDISEHKRLERVASEELMRAVEVQKLESDRIRERDRADVAEQNAAKHLQYIDFSSHELRNPLGAIMQAVDLSRLQLENLTEGSGEIQEVLEHLQSLEICARHMNRIVDDTLSFSQLDHGALQVALLPCDLQVTIKEVLSMFRAEFNVNKIKVTLDIAEVGMVLTDASRFSQILINMLTNALKFAPHDGTGKITVSLSKSATSDPSKAVRIDCFIRDNGPGMSKTTLESLFERFSQASAKTHVQYGGSGLGLYISRCLTELLGGEIQARSDLGQGTELNFYVMATPLVSDVPRPVLPKSRTQSSRIDLPVARSTKSSRSLSNDEHALTILIVEDNLLNQKLMKKLLQNQYNVLTADNGLECVDTCQSHGGDKIDLVLCDCEMPVMSGYEAVAKVKSWAKQTGRRPLPFLAVSANSRPEQVKMMLDAGMDDTIAKPVNRTELLAAIDRVLACV